MPIVYLIVSVFMNASYSIFGELFNRRNEGKTDSSAFYTLLLMISVCLSWGILYACDFTFEPSVLLYSVLFAVCYILTNIGMINALKYGSVTLTTLLISLSLIVTTIWGFIFWDAKLTVPVVVGLIFVVMAIYLCLYTKDKEEKSFSFKWLFFVMLAFFGNAGCTIVQRTQQVKFNGQHGNMLMLFATFFSVLFCLFMYLKSDKKDSKGMLKSSWWAPVCAGVANVVLNILVMLMALTTLSPSLIYPVIGVGGLAVVTVFSLFVFKEKMHWWQWIGIVIGMFAVLLLSIS